MTNGITTTPPRGDILRRQRQSLRVRAWSSVLSGCRSKEHIPARQWRCLAFHCLKLTVCKSGGGIATRSIDNRLVVRWRRSQKLLMHVHVINNVGHSVREERREDSCVKSTVQVGCRYKGQQASKSNQCEKQARLSSLKLVKTTQGHETESTSNADARDGDLPQCKDC
jgi:hypothetical protein